MIEAYLETEKRKSIGKSHSNQFCDEIREQEGSIF